MFRPCFLFLLLGLGLLSCRHVPPVAPAAKEPLLIYLMAGQSNMAGRGVIEPQDTLTDPRILSMDSSNRFVPAREPLNHYQPALAGLDCGMSFAGSLLTYTKGRVRIGLIPCAVGSTSVEEWLYDSVRIVPLYSNLIARARAGALQGHIQGILWHQGERNAEDTTAGQYAAHMTALIRKWRQDLGDDQLPVFMGKLAPFCNRPYREEVNAGLEATAQALPRVFVVETAGLTCKPDSIHFDAPAQRQLGMRFARVAGPLLD